MKQVLVIDENPPFREYLKTKLTANDIDVTTASGKLDGLAKLRTEVPDLIILDYHLSSQGCLEVLQAKKINPNTVNVPVIVMAQQIDQRKLVALLPYNIKKVFTKPIKIDALLSIISEVLDVSFYVDESPGIIEVHANEDILFVEAAQGLNQDKVEMLRFKIMELIELNSIKTPKLILMLSDMVLGYADAPNLEALCNVIGEAVQIKHKNIRVLTRDDFVKKFIEGRKEYKGIEVVSNLQYAMDGLLAEKNNVIDHTDKDAVFIVDKVLSSGSGVEGEAMQLRFDAESKPKELDADAIKEFMQGISIAAVDDDPTILEIIKNTIRKAGGDIYTYTSVSAFLDVVGQINFDVILLDLLMPEMDGFTVYNNLHANNIQTPVIVISSLTGRETVLRVFQQGIKSYITKPFQSDAIIRKIIEILRPSI